MPSIYQFSKIKFKKILKRKKISRRKRGQFWKEQQDQSVTYCDEHWGRTRNTPKSFPTHSCHFIILPFYLKFQKNFKNETILFGRKKKNEVENIGIQKRKWIYTNMWEQTNKAEYRSSNFSRKQKRIVCRETKGKPVLYEVKKLISYSQKCTREIEPVTCLFSFFLEMVKSWIQFSSVKIQRKNNNNSMVGAVGKEVKFIVVLSSLFAFIGTTLTSLG